MLHWLVSFSNKLRRCYAAVCCSVLQCVAVLGALVNFNMPLVFVAQRRKPLGVIDALALACSLQHVL